jgi:hypothetical protein
MGFLSPLHRRQAGRKLARVTRFVPRLEGLEDRTVPSTLTVLNNHDGGAGSLRDTIARARDGDTIVFDPGLSGQTIALTSDELAIKKGLDIEGPGADKLAVSGSDKYRVFDLVTEGLNVTLAGLTITRGLGNGQNGGGGVVDVGSRLNLVNDVFYDNTASYAGQSTLAQGGAVANWNGGNLTMTGCMFRNNRAVARGSNCEGAEGGAISNNSSAGAPDSTLTIFNSVFIGNQAIGEDGGVLTGSNSIIGFAGGGAINNAGHSTLTVVGSTFSDNKAVAGNGGSGGNAPFYAIDGAVGGAIRSGEDTTLVIDRCSFEYNLAIGGSNAAGGASGDGRVGLASGGAVDNQNQATIANSTFIGNAALAGSGNRAGAGSVIVGRAAGGAINNWFFPGEAPGTLVATDLTFTGNLAVGGNANSGGPYAGYGVGGALSNQSGAAATVTGSDFIGNQAIGGAGRPGASGGNGLGGGVYNDGQSSLAVTGSTITDNSATGGAAGSGGSAGRGVGGGTYFAAGGAVCLDAFTQSHVKNNHASTDHDNLFGDFTTCS